MVPIIGNPQDRDLLFSQIEEAIRHPDSVDPYPIVKRIPLLDKRVSISFGKGAPPIMKQVCFACFTKSIALFLTMRVTNTGIVHSEYGCNILIAVNKLGALNVP